MLGAVASVALIGRSRLVAPLVVAIAVSGVAVASLGLFSLVVPIVLCFAVCGGGQSIAWVASGSLIPRLAPPERLARVYGVVEGLEGAANVIGSITIASLIAWWGLRPAVVVVGLLVPLSIGVLRRGLQRIDAVATAPDPALVALVETDADLRRADAARDGAAGSEHPGARRRRRRRGRPCGRAR